MSARASLPAMPARIAKLPIDSRGYPVPFFVAYVDGRPDFRIMDPRKWMDCVQFGRCWICGETLGGIKAFTIGPMCAINRISAEPPSHRECAEFAAKACPFLILPKAQRREANMPELAEPPGSMLRRNPGVALVWVTRKFRRVTDGKGGLLFEVGDPLEALWFAEGRVATRAEVLASIESGLPSLQELCDSDDDREELAKRWREAAALLPEVTP